MNKVFAGLIEGFDFTNDIQRDSYNFFVRYNKAEAAEHSLKVANEARRIAKMFGLNEEAAFNAGCLHDIGGVLAGDQQIEIAPQLEIELYEEEKLVPYILHQRISKVMAREIFCISDENILSAIECHTTLRAHAKPFDMVLFTADKLSWDISYNGPFKDKVIAGFNISLEKGTFEYINYLFENKETMKVIHPWLKEAYDDLKRKLASIIR